MKSTCMKPKRPSWLHGHQMRRTWILAIVLPSRDFWAFPICIHLYHCASRICSSLLLLTVTFYLAICRSIIPIGLWRPCHDSPFVLIYPPEKYRTDRHLMTILTVLRIDIWENRPQTKIFWGSTEQFLYMFPPTNPWIHASSGSRFLPQSKQVYLLVLCICRTFAASKVWRTVGPCAFSGPGELSFQSSAFLHLLISQFWDHWLPQVSSIFPMLRTSNLQTVNKAIIATLEHLDDIWSFFSPWAWPGVSCWGPRGAFVKVCGGTTLWRFGGSGSSFCCTLW